MTQQEPREPPTMKGAKRSKSSILLWSTSAWIICLLVVCLSVNLLRESALKDRHETATKENKKLSLGKAPILLTYEDFNLLKAFSGWRPLNELPQAEQLARGLLFLQDLIQIGRHNLASISGLNTYYLQQSPLQVELDLLKLRTNSSAMVGGDAHEEQPVSGSFKARIGAVHGKVNFFARMYKKIKGNSEDDAIPNFPLDQQKDPERTTHIDADLRFCLGGIRDQKRCGACYAFSTMALVEWHHCRQNEGELVDFSEQYIVDCGSRFNAVDGCQSGKLSGVNNFINLYGLKLEDHLKYTGRESKNCPNSILEQNVLKVKVNYWHRIKIDREEFERTLEEQPILLEVYLPTDIESYSRGIHPGNNCMDTFAHGMLLVGHGRQDGLPYWLLRNSMGRHWGEQGYLRLSRDMPNMSQCFGTAFVSKFKFKDLKDDAYLDLYDSFKFEPSDDDPKIGGEVLVRRLLEGANESESGSQRERAATA